MRRIWVGVLVSVLLPITAAAQATENRWSWSGSVGAGKWVRIASLNGPIHVQPSPDGRVHVTAEKRWTRGDRRHVRFEVVERNGNVTVCAMWHDNQECTEQGLRGRGERSRSDNDVSVHFRVLLPATANVAPTTVNGEIKVSGARREVQATTVNGGIDLSSNGGSVSGTTVNGSIHARVTNPGAGELTFTTVNGAIEVAVPRAISADVRMTTVTGGISSDFPLTVQGRWGPRSASGTLGNGDGDVKMTTVNGSLALRSL